MTLAEKIAMATLVVGIISIFAAWLQPTNNRGHRIIAALVLLFLVGIAAWIGVTVSTRNSSEPLTDTYGSSSTAGTTATTPRTSTPPTTTFTAPLEPGETSTRTTTATTSVITGTIQTRANPQPAKLDEKRDSLPPPSDPTERPRGAGQQWSRAIALSTAGQWTDAVDAWREFIREHSGSNRIVDRESFHRLGIAYEALQQWNEAVAAFQSADRVNDPNATSDLMHLGHCYIQLRRWPDAVNAYQRVLKIDPTNQQARNSLYWSVKQQMPQ